MQKLRDILTSKKFLRTCAISFSTIILILLAAYLFLFLNRDEALDNTETADEILTEKPEALMLLIEFEDSVGLNNFVSQMYERDIPGLLMVNAQYVEQNCSLVKGLQSYNIEIAGLYPQKPFWDVAYDEQYEAIENTKNRIEACIEKPIRVIGSQYFAYDENTLQVADALGIPYVFARGTTGSEATIYQTEEYDAKIFSVSNIDSPKWGTGSLCDYSYWAREGDPEDFKIELYKAFEKHDKVSPVSHTYIGGAKQRWNEVYIDMFDNLDINWATLDEFAKVDILSSFEEVPVNREVQYKTPKPAIPLDEEIEVNNPCAVVESSEQDSTQSSDIDQEQLVMFHNNAGSMCLEAIRFFKENDMGYIEYLTTDDDSEDKLREYKKKYGSKSEGVSDSYGYYPMIFYKGRAFSGFNESISRILKSL